jgi:hypothetical protein
MRVPKPGMAFHGEVPFLFSIAQVEALWPSGSLPGEEHLAKASIGCDDIAAIAIWRKQGERLRRRSLRIKNL